MATITNNTVKLIHMGAIMCIPGATTEVPDEYLTNARVMELMEEGDLATGAPPPDGGETGATGTARRVDVAKPTHPASHPTHKPAAPVTKVEAPART